jgi:hypothetical protein
VASVRRLAHPQRDLAVLRELTGIAQQIEQYLLEPQGVRGERAHVLLRVDNEAVLVLLGELPRGADYLIDKPCQIDWLGIEFAAFQTIATERIGALAVAGSPSFFPKILYKARARIEQAVGKLKRQGYEGSVVLRGLLASECDAFEAIAFDLYGMTGQMPRLRAPSRLALASYPLSVMAARGGAGAQRGQQRELDRALRGVQLGGCYDRAVFRRHRAWARHYPQARPESYRRAPACAFWPSGR